MSTVTINGCACCETSPVPSDCCPDDPTPTSLFLSYSAITPFNVTGTFHPPALPNPIPLTWNATSGSWLSPCYLFDSGVVSGGDAFQCEYCFVQFEFLCDGDWAIGPCMGCADGDGLSGNFSGDCSPFSQSYTPAGGETNGNPSDFLDAFVGFQLMPCQGATPDCDFDVVDGIALNNPCGWNGSTFSPTGGGAVGFFLTDMVVTS